MMILDATCATSKKSTRNLKRIVKKSGAVDLHYLYTCTQNVQEKLLKIQEQKLELKKEAVKQLTLQTELLQGILHNLQSQSQSVYGVQYILANTD